MGSRVDGWQVELASWIKGAASPVHLVGVGNPIKRDDAAGLEVISTLRRIFGGSAPPSTKIHAATRSPERVLSKLALSGERVVVFDAVEAEREPGAIVCASLGDTKFGYFATHNIPLKLVPGVAEKRDQICIVGIQPESLEVGEGLSEPVRIAVATVADAVASLARSSP